MLNLRQAETAADVHDSTNHDESNYALVRGFSTLQRHVSLRLQTISSHLKKDTQDTNVNQTIEEEEPIELQDPEDDTKVHKYSVTRDR